MGIITNQCTEHVSASRTMPTFIKFYEFPPEKLHGVVAKVEM